MQLIKKIIFLYKSNSSLKIYYSFLVTKIKNVINKNKIKLYKKNHIKFLKNKFLTHDYFSSHSYNFHTVLKNFNNFKYLEIGSFEGNSSMFVAKNFPNSRIYCIDNWVGTEEYGDLKFSIIEKNFDKNMKEFVNYQKFKQTSDDFFKNNKCSFDVIYIDGYHKGYQVFEDFKNSWQVLKSGGIIIFDDFIWNFFEKIEDNPCYVINLYLKKINKNVKILKVSNSQLFIQKIM